MRFSWCKTGLSAAFSVPAIGGAGQVGSLLCPAMAVCMVGGKQILFLDLIELALDKGQRKNPLSISYVRISRKLTTAHEFIQIGLCLDPSWADDLKKCFGICCRCHRCIALPLVVFV